MLLTLLMVLTICISSCSKFEDGPCISFKSKEKRLQGEWLLKYWTVDGVDSLQYWNNYFANECKFNFNPWNGNYAPLYIEWGIDTSHYYYVFGAYDGFVDEYLSLSAFKPGENSTAFPLNFLAYPHPNNTLVEWTVKKLEYKEVWFSMNVNNKTYELHLENIKK